MSPQLQERFMAEIAPIIETTLPRYVYPQAGEDRRDLIQDALVAGCQMADSLERRGQPVIANSVAFYTIQNARAGRRALNAGRTDVFSPRCQIDGHSLLVSLDEPHADDEPAPEDDDEQTLHAALADPQDDPATQAMRRVDWGGFVPQLSQQQQLRAGGDRRGRGGHRAGRGAQGQRAAGRAGQAADRGEGARVLGQHGAGGRGQQARLAAGKRAAAGGVGDEKGAGRAALF